MKYDFFGRMRKEIMNWDYIVKVWEIFMDFGGEYLGLRDVICFKKFD